MKHCNRIENLRRHILVILSLTLVFLSSCSSFITSRPEYSIQVINESQVAICKIQTTPSSSQPIFIGNRLGGSKLEPGKQLLIDGLKNQYIAIRAESCENNRIVAADYEMNLVDELVFVVTDSNLIDWDKVEFPTPQSTPTHRDSQPFYLDNNSDYSICTFQMAFRSSSPRFSNDLLHNNFVEAGEEWGPISVEYATYILRFGLCDGRTVDVDNARIWSETHFDFSNKTILEN